MINEIFEINDTIMMIGAPVIFVLIIAFIINSIITRKYKIKIAKLNKNIRELNAENLKLCSNKQEQEKYIVELIEKVENTNKVNFNLASKMDEIKKMLNNEEMKNV